MKIKYKLLLAALPFLTLACSQPKQSPTVLNDSSQEVSSSTAKSQPIPRKLAQEQGTPNEEHFTPGGAADDGVNVNSNQITREKRNPVLSGKRKARSGSHRIVGGDSNDYINEKQSKNYGLPRGRTGKARIKYKEINLPQSDFVPSNEPVAREAEAHKFKAAFSEPISTFSADVDTASYSNIRRELQHGQRPRPELVRVEEMLNYFNYDLPEPKESEPFSITTELSTCPWNSKTELLRVAVKTKSLDRGDAPPRNLVFLLDVSGSMHSADKLPLLKKSLRQLVDTLDDADRVAIVVYAGGSGVVLPSTTGDQKVKLLEAIELLRAGGGTNGEQGIKLAYQIAQEHRSEDSVNRIILATDGDFNLGVSSDDELKALIEEKRESGLFLSVLGFGRGGNDKTMETLADHGNGNYASIDSLHEAKKVLVKESGATLVTVAKDVKFQVVFNPEEVENYRLIGYKNRRLATRDFDDDTKDAGELGAGHEVTALYEIKRKDGGFDEALLKGVGLDLSASLATLKMRYKAPDADESQLIERKVSVKPYSLDESSSNQQWAAAVAGFGLRLEGELSKQELPIENLYSLLSPTMAKEPDAYEAEFYSLVKKSEELL